MNAKLNNSIRKSRTGHVVASAVLTALLMVSTATAQPKVPMLRKAGSNMNYAAGRVLVRMNPTVTAAAKGKLSLPGVSSMKQLTGNSNAASAKGTNRPTWFVAHLNPDMSVEQALVTLAADPSVSAVKPDFIRSIPRPIASLSAAATDPDEGQQYALERIEAAAAWQIEAGKKSVVVAVIDTGVQMNHPDLSSQMWTNPNETDNGVDDDNNGFVDDVRGWNFVSGNNNPDDDNEHGTHCSGIVAATRGNGVGIAGTANVTIMPVKVLDHAGRGAFSATIQGVQYAANNGASIISLSRGAAFDEAEAEVYREVIGRGVVVIAASGNESANQISYPAGYEGVIAVGATDINDQIASFSNTGEGLAITAPGVDILSTIPGSNYKSMGGTSMATPYVAGVAALVRSANSSLTAAQVRQQLMDSADDLGDPGFDLVYGAGRVNARKALAGGTPNPNPNPTPTPNPTPAPGGNTSPDKALPIQPGQYKGTCQSELWYKINLTRSAKIDITLSGNQGDLDLFVMDLDGQSVADSASDGSNEQISTNIAAGQYLVAIAAYEGKSGSFSMTYASSAEAPGNPGTPDPNYPDYPVDPDDGYEPMPTEMFCGATSGMPMLAMVAGLMGLGTTIRRRK